MPLTPRILEFPETRLLGVRSLASFNSDTTSGLWARFRARVYPPNRAQFGDELYSVAVYPKGFFAEVDPEREFEKWAAARFSGDTSPHEIAEWLHIPGGLYAVFRYQGKASDGAVFFKQIFNSWLPQSGYRVDHRPHFEILPPAYDPNDPLAKEDVYIPITGG